jgi:hypothetical protein
MGGDGSDLEQGVHLFGGGKIYAQHLGNLLEPHDTRSLHGFSITRIADGRTSRKWCAQNLTGE